MFKFVLASVALVATATTPALATNSASSLSLQNFRASSETSEGSELAGGGVAAAIGALAIVAGAIILVVGSDDDEPVSP